MLIEFAKQMGFRPIDLWSAFEKDKSNTLDRQEIKMWLRACTLLVSPFNLELDNTSRYFLDFAFTEIFEDFITLKISLKW